MIEVFSVVALILGFLGVLAYLYFHTKEEREYIRKIQTDLTQLPIELQKFYSTISERDTDRTQKLIKESFSSYLKHIERLEKMVLPKPVTTKDVQSVIDRMGPLAENEIEKESEKLEMLEEPNWAALINPDTKVAFEDDTDEPIVE